MNEVSLEALCRALSLAGIEYADFQRVVTIFFIGWKCEVDSEGLADVTLDRLGQVPLYKKEKAATGAGTVIRSGVGSDRLSKIGFF